MSLIFLFCCLSRLVRFGGCLFVSASALEQFDGYHMTIRDACDRTTDTTIDVLDEDPDHVVHCFTEGICKGGHGGWGCTILGWREYPIDLCGPVHNPEPSSIAAEIDAICNCLTFLLEGWDDRIKEVVIFVDSIFCADALKGWSCPMTEIDRVLDMNMKFKGLKKRVTVSIKHMFKRQSHTWGDRALFLADLGGEGEQKNANGITHRPFYP